MEDKAKITLLQEGKYQVESVLGAGGFGNTYLATQVALGRKVAIKEFFMKDYCDRDQTTSRVITHTASCSQIVDRYRQKFLKEAQMIAALKNEHIVQIYDIFEENDTAYYVMEYIPGKSLKDKVERDGALTETEAIRYIRQVAEALSYLHSNNILHLDVKPANILLNADDSPILIDFGISKHYDSEGGQTSTTPAGISKGFAPIEQYQQDNISSFTPSTDIYSLGATLFYLLTGQVPPEASHIYEDGLPSVINEFSPQLQKALAVAMSPRRKDRFQSASSFIEALSGIESGKTSVTISAPEQNAEETTIILEEKKVTPPIMKDALPKDNESGIWLKIVLLTVFVIILPIGLFSLGGNQADKLPKERQKPAVTATTPAKASSTSKPAAPTKAASNKAPTPASQLQTDTKASNLKSALNSGDYASVKKLADDGYAPAYLPLAKYYLQSPSTHNLADKYAKKAKNAGVSGAQDVIAALEAMGFYD